MRDEPGSPHSGPLRGFTPVAIVPFTVSSSDQRVTPTVVTEAVADVMRASNPGSTVDMALATKIGGDIRPALEKALSGRVGSGAELVGLSTFRTILSQYLGSPAAADIEADRRKSMQHTLENANRTGADFSALVAGAGHRLASLGNLSPEVAREVARTEERGRSSTDFNMAFNGGTFTSHNLSADMRSYVDPSRGITSAHLAQVGNYLTGLGINAGQYTGYFAGSSDTFRSALREHIKSGAKITDAHITNPNDVKAVLGAIKAGKMKPEDAPPSVRAVIDDMKNKGIDPATADPKAMDKYFKENPKALDAARKSADKDIRTQSHLSDDDKTKQMQAAAAATAPLNSSPTKTDTVTMASAPTKAKPNAKVDKPASDQEKEKPKTKTSGLGL